MTTTLVTLSGAISLAQTKTCSAISRAFRLLLIPRSRVAERAAHRASDLRGDAYRAPGLLGDHDRLYSVTVAGVEQILSRTVGSLRDTLQGQGNRRSLLGEHRLQSSGQVRGLSPVAHERTGEGFVDLAVAVRWFVPLLENRPHIR